MRGISVVPLVILSIALPLKADSIVAATYTVWTDTSASSAPITAVGSSTVSVNFGTGLYPTPTGMFQGEATAGPNDLGVYGEVAGANPAPGTNQGGSAQSIAYFQDALLVSGPASGYLNIIEDVEGDSINLDYGTGYSLTETYLRLSTGQGTACVSAVSNGSVVSGCGDMVDGLNNHFLLPYTVAANGTISLGGEFFTFDDCFVTAASGYNSCFGQADYIDTAQIASITVEDLNGNPVPGATATSLSGVNYGLPVATTPEPASAMLVASGLGMLGFLRRRQLRQHKSLRPSISCVS